MTKWVPTAQRFKLPLEKADAPTAEIQFGYNWTMVWIKLAVFIAAAAGTGAAAHLLFTTNFAGLSFLNSSSLRQNKKTTLAKKVESMSAAKLEKLLVAVKERRRQADSNCVE